VKTLKTPVRFSRYKITMSTKHRRNSDEDSDEDLHNIDQILSREMGSHKNRGPIVIVRRGNQVRGQDSSDCPCQHYPNCPYRQEAERLRKLNKSWELELRSTKIRLDVLTEDNEKMKKSIEKSDERIDELKNMINAIVTANEKRESEHREIIDKLQQDIIEIKHKKKTIKYLTSCCC